MPKRARTKRTGYIVALAGLLTCFAVSKPCLAQTPNREPADTRIAVSDQPDFNREIYYKNKLEFAFDTGWLWYNTPLVLDPIIGQKFAREPGVADYTLVPLNFSLRAQLYDICGPSILRGNTDFSFTGSYTVIEQGPESYYASAMAGVRYNFIQPNWRMVPYLELRGGMGFTDAQQPYEAAHHQPEAGQGQDFTFTFTMGAGVRYNFSPTYSLSAGIAFMHISNLYLSEPKYYNHGVNVVGPTIGLNIALPTITSAVRTMSEGVKVPLDEIARQF